MTDPGEDSRIPEAVPPLPLPEFEYEDLEKQTQIGTGGDADVYRADLDHDGYTYAVAIKEPRFDGTIQKQVLEKFQTEAETWSSLNDHDNIVSVYDWGADPLPWLALEYMDAGTLQDKIGSVDVAEALWLSGRIAEGVRYGHRYGVAHLDIKPANVLLRDTPEGKWEYPKVSDWGLAKMLLEHSNSIEGISPTYGAPEQFASEEYGDPDDITDIYQLGAVVYALVTGEPPFSGSSRAIMQGVLQEEPDPPSVVNPSVPAAVDKVVLKALEKEKDNRYDGILTFRQELDQLFDEYSAGDIDTTDASTGGATASSTDESTEEESDQANTTETNSSEPEQGGSDTQSSANTPNKTASSPVSTEGSISKNTNDSSIVSRRSTLGLLGVIGGGGLIISQIGQPEENVTQPEEALSEYRAGRNDVDEAKRNWENAEDQWSENNFDSAMSSIRESKDYYNDAETNFRNVVKITVELNNQEAKEIASDSAAFAESAQTAADKAIDAAEAALQYGHNSDEYERELQESEDHEVSGESAGIDEFRGALDV